MVGILDSLYCNILYVKYYSLGRATAYRFGDGSPDIYSCPWAFFALLAFTLCFSALIRHRQEIAVRAITIGLRRSESYRVATKDETMGKIEISTPEPERALPVLQDALERQKRLVSQSLARTEEKIQHLAAYLRVDPDRLLAEELRHPEERDMELLELEGELELRRHLREQLQILEHLKLCP